MAIVIKGGFWDNEEGLGTAYAVRASKQVYKQLRNAVKGHRGRRLREILIEVTGTAAGATAAASQSQVQGQSGITHDNAGGIRPIETSYFVNRATAADDITLIDAQLARTPQPTYPEDLSGNGGGGKVGY